MMNKLFAGEYFSFTYYFMGKASFRFTANESFGR